MAIDSISNYATLQNATNDGQQLGKQQFLELLVAQMANQDPLNPLDDKQFIAQLAQFSSLEQQMAANEQLTNLQLAQSAMANAQMASLLGREIVARTDSVTVAGDGTPTNIGLRLDADAAQVELRIVDENGKVVRTIKAGPMDKGQQSVTWDGRGDNGALLPKGTYKVEVTAKNSAGDAVTTATEMTGVVTGVTFENGYAELIMGDVRVTPANVVELREQGV